MTPVKISLTPGGRLAIQAPLTVNPILKQLGATWYRPGRCWTLPGTPAAAESLSRALRAARLWNPETVPAAVHALIEQAAARAGDYPARTPARTALSPWAHQAAAYSFASSRPAALLDLAPGTGKTKVAVDLFVNDCPEGAIGLVLCPLSVVRDVWERQVPIHSGDPNLVVVALDRGTVAQRTKQAEASIKVARAAGCRLLLVINYESAWREPFATMVERHEWDLMVLDESHRIKSPTGKISKFARSAMRRARRRLCLTGTPAPHSPLDLWAQLDALEPGLVQPTFHAFRSQYAIMGGFEGKQVVAFRDLENLRARMKPVYFKVGNEVLDLPAVMHERRTCKLPAPARKIYDHLRDDLYAYIDGDEMSISTALEKILRLQQLTSGFYKPDGEEQLKQLHTAKIDLLQELLEDLPRDEPVVVFARFLADLDAIAQVAERVKRPAYELSGRRRELEAWKQAGGGEVLAAQIQAGGVGIDLTRARYCVYMSTGYSLGDYIQSLARVHRPGQERPVVFYHLVTEDTIDEQVYDALSRKEDVVAAVVGRVGVGYDAGLQRV